MNFRTCEDAALQSIEVGIPNMVYRARHAKTLRLSMENYLKVVKISETTLLSQNAVINRIIGKFDARIDLRSIFANEVGSPTNLLGEDAE